MFESLREPVSNEKMEFDLANFPLTFQNEATVGISFESLKELVSNEEIKVEDEKDVFDLIIKWTKHDRDKRMDFFPELFEQVASFDRTYKLVLGRSSIIIDNQSFTSLILINRLQNWQSIIIQKGDT